MMKPGRLGERVPMAVPQREQNRRVTGFKLPMTTVALFEAKTRLSELLAQVQRGEEILITRHGVPMARLVPPLAPSRRRTPTQRQRVDAAFEALAGLWQGVSLDVPLRQAIDAGRD